MTHEHMSHQWESKAKSRSFWRHGGPLGGYAWRGGQPPHPPGGVWDDGAGGRGPGAPAAGDQGAGAALHHRAGQECLDHYHHSLTHLFRLRN